MSTNNVNSGRKRRRIVVVGRVAAGASAASKASQFASYWHLLIYLFKTLS
jgi:hypothetical protein